MDPDDLRADIPALERTTYLNTGASGPAPRQVVQAAEECLQHHEYEAPAGEGKYTAAFDALDRAREAVAGHLNADETDVALVESTGDGIARLAAAVDWEPGDVVVRTDLEHPAGILPWQRLERHHGVEVRVVESDRGRVDPDEFARAAEGARLVCLSSVCWTTGTRLPVADLVEVAHDAGARVLVDAVQSVGQHPVDVGEWGADAVAASGHKWLMATWGAGFLWVDSEFAADLHPAHVGYFGVDRSGGGPTNGGYALAEGARRFELGTRSLAPFAALTEAIDVVEAVGYDVILARIERLTDRLKAGIDDDRLLSPAEFESGLVSFRVDDAEATVERLTEAGIRIRSLPAGETVRVSVHAFNTAEDVDRLLDHL